MPHRRGWISSSYYMQNLPRWLTQLNAKKLPEAYLAKSWKTLYPIETYVQSTPNSWSISSADEELGLVYVPLGG